MAGLTRLCPVPNLSPPTPTPSPPAPPPKKKTWANSANPGQTPYAASGQSLHYLHRIYIFYKKDQK